LPDFDHYAFFVGPTACPSAAPHGIDQEHPWAESRFQIAAISIDI
jgi:hypothetical protein